MLEIEKLNTKNGLVKFEHQQLISDNRKVPKIIKFWNKSSVSIEKPKDLQKPLGDRTVLGFGSYDSNLTDSNDQVCL